MYYCSHTQSDLISFPFIFVLFDNFISVLFYYFIFPFFNALCFFFFSILRAITLSKNSYFYPFYVNANQIKYTTLLDSSDIHTLCNVLVVLLGAHCESVSIHYLHIIHDTYASVSEYMLMNDWYANTFRIHTCA